MTTSFAALRSWSSKTTTPLKESTKENISVPNSPTSSEKDVRAIRRIEAKKLQSRQYRNQYLWLAAVWAAVWVKDFEKKFAVKQRVKEQKVEELMNELRGDNTALNEQMTALKTAKKVLQSKLSRVEEELKASEAKVNEQNTIAADEAAKAKQTINQLSEERASLLVLVAELEQRCAAEQQAKTRLIYHHQEEIRAVRVDHERERDALMETIKQLQENLADEKQRVEQLSSEMCKLKEDTEKLEVNYERQITQIYRVYYDLDELKTQFLWSKIPVPLGSWEDKPKQAGEEEGEVQDETSKDPARRISFWGWLRVLLGGGN